MLSEFNSPVDRSFPDPPARGKRIETGRTSRATLPGVAFGVRTRETRGKVIMNDGGYTTEESTEAASANGPKPLRDALDAQKQQNKALMDRLAALEAQVTKNTVADLFESNGVARSFAQHYQGDATPDAINQFIQDARSAFGAAPAAPAQATPPATPFDQKQYEQMTQAGADGTPVSNMDDAMSALRNATSPDQLM